MVELEQPLDDLPIDTGNLSVGDLSRVFAQTVVAAEVQEVAGPVIHDEKVGTIEPRQPVQSVPVPVQPEPVKEPEAAHKEEEDIEEQKRPRHRLRPRSDEEVLVFQEMSKNANLTYKQAEQQLIKDGKLKPSGEAPQVQDTPAQSPAPAPIDELEARIAELAAKIEAVNIQAADAKANYNFEDEAKFLKEAAALDKEWREKTHAFTRSLAKSEPAAKAPEAAPQLSAAEEAAFMEEVAADQAAVYAAYPGLDQEESGPLKPMHDEMVKLKAEWEAKGDPIIDSPRIMSALAFAAAAKLNVRIVADAPRVTAPVPGPAGAAPRMAAAPPKPEPFDAEEYAARFNSYTLPSAFA